VPGVHLQQLQAPAFEIAREVAALDPEQQLVRQRLPPGRQRRLLALQRLQRRLQLLPGPLLPPQLLPPALAAPLRRLARPWPGAGSSLAGLLVPLDGGLHGLYARAQLLCQLPVARVLLGRGRDARHRAHPAGHQPRLGHLSGEGLEQHLAPLQQGAEGPACPLPQAPPPLPATRSQRRAVDQDSVLIGKTTNNTRV
jgi:hypothetical protein